MAMKYDTPQEQAHAERIRAELEDAGVSRLALYKPTSRYLSNVIGKNEHIKAVVFGRRSEIEGFFGFIGGALVATDKRILFVDHRPGYTTMDEVGYDIVTGINVSHAGSYAGLVLYTKIGNYELSFASHPCVTNFERYIETRRVVDEDYGLVQRYGPRSTYRR